MQKNGKKLVIFGAGQIAELACFYFTHDSPYEVAGFTVDREYLKQDKIAGLPVVPFDEVTKHFPPATYDGFVAVSFYKVNKLRAEKFAAMEALGYSCASYVSSRAITWPDFSCGPNCFIMELNNIQPYVKIGKNVTLWSGNHIGHHTVIGDHCFIASHVVVSGSVKLGEYSFLGVNATTRDNIKIGVANVIGAGCLILHDTKDYQVFRGPETEAMPIPSNRLKGL